jgi:uncharacterized protein YhjY with autotransporter beta-barrel domain/phospholipase/lecithinase/hemolysin
MLIRKIAALLAASTASLVVAAAPAQAQQVDRIVAFGDSYVDDGNLFQILGFNPAPQVYPTGRFSGGTNYVDTLSQILGVPVENFGIGGALTGNTNTNGPGLPGFAFEYTSFLNGGGGVFPTVDPTFDENDLLVVSIGGNDARFYERNSGTLAGAPAAATTSVAQAKVGLDALVAAGAPTISFLAGNTAILPEPIAPGGTAIRNAFSTTFNSGIQPVLASYAANGTIVHYLDLTVIGQQIIADPTAYGLTSAGACAPAPQCIANPAYANQFLFYVDNLHLTSAGFAIVGQYVAAQLQAPLTFQATAELGQDTARQFARTLGSRMDLGDGSSATGMQLFVVGDAFSRKVDESQRSDRFDVEGAGVTAGASFGFSGGRVGIAANYSRPRARFAVDTARVKGDSWQLGGFAGFSAGAIVAQGYAGYGKDDLDIRREGVNERVTASADGDHWLAGAKLGFMAGMGGLRVGPVAALDYTRASVDGYEESGDPALDLNVGKMRAKSLTGGIGGELRGDLTAGGLRVRPFASAMLEKTLDGDRGTVRFSQTSAPTIVNSWDLGERSKRAYGRLSGGGSAELWSGASVNALVSSTISRKDEDELSAHVGLNFGF